MIFIVDLWLAVEPHPLLEELDGTKSEEISEGLLQLAKGWTWLRTLEETRGNLLPHLGKLEQS